MDYIRILIRIPAFFCSPVFICLSCIFDRLYSVLFVFVFILTIWEPQASVMALLFECVSALSTVGSSLNLTPTLGDNSKLLVAFLMFIGRVGLITLMLGIIKQKKHTKYQYPSGQIIIN